MITPFVDHFVTVREGPLEKLWGVGGVCGGGEFFEQHDFVSFSVSLE